MTAARPWMKFGPKRWRTDEALRMCGAAARGLWVELMCIMHEAEPYGHLLVRGKQPSQRVLAVMVGLPEAEIPALFAELEENEVFSRTEDGTIYSRGMVRDEELHLQSSGYGQKGVAAKARKAKAEKAASRGGSSGGSSPPTKRGLKPESEEEKEERPPVAPKNKSGVKRELPDDWEPAEFGEGTQSRQVADGWSRLEFERQLERFRAHHVGAGSRFVDWQSAWSTWVLNSVRFAERDAARSPGGQPAGSSFVDVVLAEAEATGGKKK